MLAYRNTPHSTTKQSPAQLLFKRNLRCRLDLLQPDLKTVVEKKQEAQAKSKSSRRMREFQLDQRVSIRNFSDNRKWVTGVVQSRIGPLTYLVKLQDGRLCKRHVDQMIECYVKDSSPSSTETDYVYLPCSTQNSHTPRQPTRPAPRVLPKRHRRPPDKLDL